ncbi:MAG TPA: acetate--CoA ligase family protein, partial [Paraburkholderia sp.]
DKPLMLAWNARRDMASEAYRVIEAAGVPLYATPVRCGRAFAVLSDYAQARRTRVGTRTERAPAPDQLRVETASALIAQSPADLTEHAAQHLLGHYGIATPKSALAKSLEEARAFARATGFPLVVKVQSPDIPHKTEAGAVRIGIRDEAMLTSAFDEIVANARRHVPGARIEGVLVQEEIRDAVEMIVGIDNDPSFGPAVMCGLGGIYAEVLKDVAWRLAPVTRTEARAMIRELRAFAMLDGARGKPRCDVDALADAIVAMSAMALDLAPGLKEFDINPLFVLPAGKGVRAGDAFARCAPQAASKREDEPEAEHRAQAIVEG